MENVYLCLPKVPLFWLHINEFEFSWQNIKKYSDTKFHENPIGGFRVVPMRTDGQTNRQTDMT